MPEPIANALELKRSGDLNTLRQFFNEPSRLSWPPEHISQLEELYDIALKFDQDDPVGWIKDFNNAHPISIKVGSSRTRLEKILELARIYLQSRSSEKPGKLRGLRREF